MVPNPLGTRDWFHRRQLVYGLENEGNALGMIFIRSMQSRSLTGAVHSRFQVPVSSVFCIGLWIINHQRHLGSRVYIVKLLIFNQLNDWKVIWRKAMSNLDSILKSRDITWPTKIRLVKATVYPIVMYGCESWTIKKAEPPRIDAFELWCWRRLLRVLWTVRRSNQSILKEVNTEHSLEGLMLKLKLQYFGYLMWWTNSLEKTLMLGKTEGGRRNGWQRMKWLDGMSFSKFWEMVKDREAQHAAVHWVAKSWTQLSDWTTTMKDYGSVRKPMLDEYIFSAFRITRTSLKFLIRKYHLELI